MGRNCPSTIESHVIAEAMHNLQARLKYGQAILVKWECARRFGSLIFGAALFPSMTCPTSVIVGSDDKTTPITASQLIADRIPNATLK